VAELDKEKPDDGFLEDTEPPVPTQVLLTDAHLAMLLTVLAWSDVEIRSPVQARGRLGPGGDARTIKVGGQAIAIPVDAAASALVSGTKPGLLIEAGDPKPNGTSIWIAGEAARQINILLRDLDATH
jgi:hypothetical protein